MKRILLFILCVFSASVFANTIMLRNLSTEKTNAGTDVTLTLSAFPTYHTLMISNPDRFVMDMKDVKIPHSLRLGLPSQSVISDLHYAAHRDGILRMVFTLRHFSSPHIIVLQHKKTGAVKLQLFFANRKQSDEIQLNSIQPIADTIVLAPPKRTSENIKKKIAVLTVDKPVLSDQAITTTSNKYHNVIVVIDPGHGGKDPGAKGAAGIDEKNVVLSISLLLQKTINQTPGFHAVLTRTTDRYLTLRERLRVARQDHADMFVAIHADKWRNSDARGVSVFALSQRGATSEAARWIAKRENASELMGGVQLNDQSHLLQSVLINLSQSATIRASLIIGKNIMNSVKPIARLHHSRVEQAAFVVLKSPDIPSLLVETGFLSNPLEERKLSSAAYQAQLSKAIADGVRQYFVYNPPRDTWLAYWKNNLNTHRV
ncbi:MAG: N-acetylmuramoyl-L-alanine amidase [Coxiellaceae bacterium]|nr:N-acetylmuramoyl-L-alanine amidase [Coxiellaceae bacterium]